MEPDHEACSHGFLFLAHIFTLVYLGAQKEIRLSVGFQQISFNGRSAADGLLGHLVGGAGI